MSISFKEARQILKKLGIEAHPVGDGRTFYGIPFTHACGREIPWLVLINSNLGTVESGGAYCENCRGEVEAVPIDHLRLVGKPLLAEIVAMGRRLDEALASNARWFNEMMSARTIEPS
ncbi:MAG: hypothetical protein Q8O75_02840 [bacterium]|nr:hypothetical protein [bacterium]